jgi:hypothetical protein
MEKLIGSFKKNASDSVQIHLTNFMGKDLVDLRIWVQTADGKWVRTHKGICIRTDSIRALKDLIIKAEKAIDSSLDTDDGENLESAGNDVEASATNNVAHKEVKSCSYE